MSLFSKTLLFFGICAAPLYASFETDPFPPDQSVTYKTVGDKELQLHFFFPEDYQSNDSRPAMVFFYGGGWRKGSPTQFFPHSDYLASRGMIAISAEYRVTERDGTTPQECVRDAKSAMRWVREHAAEFGIDPQRILAGGGSAGGHLAVATAVLNGFNEEGEDSSVSSRPEALVLFNPVFDNGPDGYGYERVKDYWEAFSPMHNLKPNTPPTLVMLGTEDGLIPVETAEVYKKRMESLGARCDLHLYAGQPHGFFNYRHTTYYTMTVVEMDRFLESLGYLEGEPTMQVIVDPESERDE